MARKLGLGALFVALIITGPAPICGADLDITGRPARVRFRDARELFSANEAAMLAPKQQIAQCLQSVRTISWVADASLS